MKIRINDEEFKSVDDGVRHVYPWQLETLQQYFGEGNVEVLDDEPTTTTEEETT